MEISAQGIIYVSGVPIATLSSEKNKIKMEIPNMS